MRAFKSTALFGGPQKNPSRLLHCQVLWDASSAAERLARITTDSLSPATQMRKSSRPYDECACVIRPCRRLRPRLTPGLTLVRVSGWSVQLNLRPSRSTSNLCWRRTRMILVASMGPEDELSSYMLHSPSTPSPAIRCTWASDVPTYLISLWMGSVSVRFGSSGQWLEIRATAPILLS